MDCGLGTSFNRREGSELTLFTRIERSDLANATSVQIMCWKRDSFSGIESTKEPSLVI